LSELRPNLPPLPDRMRGLAVHRGYPVPHFVGWVDGVPDFRTMDGAKLRDCVRFRRCWLCGGPLGRFQTFVAGPMCGLTRTSAEPPSHLDCAQFSVQACPFLSLPKMVRREDGLPEDAVEPAGVMIKRNPGVSLLWTTRDWKLFNDGTGRPLIEMGEPTRIEWFAHGRHATREEVLASVESGLPLLQEFCESPADIAELDAKRERFMALVPR
jgi:hypothetical protein